MRSLLPLILLNAAIVCESFLHAILYKKPFLWIKEEAVNHFHRQIKTTKTIKTRTPLSASANKKLSEADKERLLLTEPALNAFIVAEMRHFITEKVTELNHGRPKWQMNNNEKIDLGLINENGTILHNDYTTDMNASHAIDILCNATSIAFTDGFVNQPGLLSALGSAICFFRNYFRETPRMIAACERVGLSDYNVAHHMTDMYHHLSFRGAYTKTLTPSGKGEVAARLAVGLPPLLEDNGDDHEQDECILWSPTTDGVCVHWKSEDEAWRKQRFEKIQMEGTRDPRRGGSGTTR